jgi:HEAT repeat protein
MGFFPQLDGRTVAELQTSFTADPSLVPGVPEEEKLFWFEEVARKLAEGGEEGLDFLLRHLWAADEVRLRAILLALAFAPKGLAEKRREQVRAELLAFIRDPRPLVAAEAIDSLSTLDDQEVEQQIVPLLHHESPYVVGSVLRYLRRTDPDRARPILLEALTSLEPIVRQNAIDELDELNCVEALPRIRPLLNDADEWVRQAARTAVPNLEELSAPAP